MKVFLGGTCADSKWRDEIEPLLERSGLDYFNPVVDDWNEAAQAQEVQERQNCDFVLYVITPKMEGVYSIAEVVEDSIKRPEKTIFVVLDKDGGSSFSKGQKKSLDAVSEMVRRNGGQSFNSLQNAVTRMSQVKSMMSHIKNVVQEK